jgi:hypothetical protein
MGVNAYMYICIYAYMHYAKSECNVSQNLRSIGRVLVAACANSEASRSPRPGSRANWALAKDSFQDMRREEAKSAQRYFFGFRADQRELSSGC